MGLCFFRSLSRALNIAAPSSGGPGPLSLSGPRGQSVCVCVCSQPSVTSVSINTLWCFHNLRSSSVPAVGSWTPSPKLG